MDIGKVRFPDNFIGVTERDFNDVFCNGNPIVGSDEDCIVWFDNVGPYTITIARFDRRWVCEFTNDETCATGIAQKVGDSAADAFKASRQDFLKRYKVDI